ncbi:hypothetical protein [Neorhizobium galegae]|uniref:hypothetical protein n=1 Tax=Neorhizobium galegae TaxID=399 RepID=UPI0006215BD3|nr:hypothetical protein [Neorhizobium galegae]CDZ60232.1 Hypothetical protein NGAL_HAMBI2566_38980 [Neorhizobium galegae bv. orientalis]KAB1120978.1 hypothetical protein F4V90_27680 [Neorhizobium galegae]MCQ1574535.1 hypothetical protein [Neorhizobium galegae]MCQ1810292.1 hypothetical protein [Neorhizobium galegae]CDZ64638.1 Hypothetical protein NGAL_HAMBI2605_30930 [Neorhizobium galegae bv. orientalis]
MIREDLRSRRIAVIADFVVNPGSALYGKRQAPPTDFMDALVERDWGITKMPPHVARLESCERLIEVSVGDLIDYRKNGYDVVIAAVEDLPQQGLWLDAMAACYKKVGKDMPPIVTIRSDATAADVDALDSVLAPAA